MNTQPPGASELSPGPVAVDQPCVACGYNLRGLDPAGTCPECGKAVAITLSEDRSFPADPVLFRNLRDGVLLIVVAAVLTAMSIEVPASGIDEARGVRWVVLVYVNYGLALSPHVLAGYGVWMASRRPSADVGLAGRPAWRWALRLLVTFAALGPFASALPSEHGVYFDTYAPWQTWLRNPVPQFGMVLVTGLVYLHLYWIGRRLPRRAREIFPILALWTALLLPGTMLWFLHEHPLFYWKDFEGLRDVPLPGVGYSSLLGRAAYLLVQPRAAWSFRDWAALAALAGAAWSVLFLSTCAWIFTRQARRAAIAERSRTSSPP